VLHRQDPQPLWSQPGAGPKISLVQPGAGPKIHLGRALLEDPKPNWVL